MPAYVAMLRGINVGGNNLVPMARLRERCEKAGLKKVRTYIQSGNIVFESAGTAKAAEKKVAAVLKEDFGCVTPVIVRTAKELSKVLADNPYRKRPGLEGTKMVFVFLSKKPVAGSQAKIDAQPRLKVEECALVGRELYLWLPFGQAKGKLAASNWEKLLDVRVTARNLNTVEKLLEMSLSTPSRP